MVISGTSSGLFEDLAFGNCPTVLASGTVCPDCVVTQKENTHVCNAEIRNLYQFTLSPVQ